MKKLGVIGGISWQSSLTYYRMINQGVNRRLGGHHSADLILWSGDFARNVELQDAGQWDQIAANLTEAGRSLAGAGCELLAIASNSAHRHADEVEDNLGVEVVSIIDATARRLGQAGLDTVALLGTRPTMSADFYRRRMADNGVTCLVPDEADQDVIQGIIFDELVHGEVHDGSRRVLIDVVDTMAERGAEGVVLGCTELGMLAAEDDFRVPGFDSTSIHVAALIDAMLA